MRLHYRQLIPLTLLFDAAPAKQLLSRAALRAAPAPAATPAPALPGVNQRQPNSYSAGQPCGQRFPLRFLYQEPHDRLQPA